MTVDILYNILDPEDNAVLIARGQISSNMMAQIKEHLQKCPDRMDITWGDSRFIVSLPEISTLGHFSNNVKLNFNTYAVTVLQDIARFLEERFGATVREPENYRAVPLNNSLLSIHEMLECNVAAVLTEHHCLKHYSPEYKNKVVHLTALSGYAKQVTCYADMILEQLSKGAEP